MSKDEDTPIVRLCMDLPPEMSSSSIIRILIDVKRHYWCFQPESLDTSNWATWLGRVDPDTFFSTLPTVGT